MTKSADIDEYKYSGYGIGFARKWNFSFGNGFGRNCAIFCVDMSFSVHVDNKKKKLILGEVPTQGLDGTTLIEKKYSHILLKIMFICLIVIFIYCINSYLFVNGIELLNLKQKIQQKDWDSETDIVTTQWCLQNISKDFCK